MRLSEAQPASVVTMDTQDPSVLYNAMVNPFLDMAIKGAIWYQGEADLPNYEYYECAFPAMIKSWRKNFRRSQVEGDFPFGFVQLSS